MKTISLTDQLFVTNQIGLLEAKILTRASKTYHKVGKTLMPVLKNNFIYQLLTAHVE